VTGKTADERWLDRHRVERLAEGWLGCVRAAFSAEAQQYVIERLSVVPYENHTRMNDPM